eukprot:TRINITY_DN10568_c0_g1_i1.p1 TRINITY_DN10568_c0_g1~~TRINITY_DN10568_c0_g1_i1.p1  ORF type:complete len:1536 (-),score=271.03 TRINITY_DN10568_c0_g1_i1:49-4656(-)
MALGFVMPSARSERSASPFAGGSVGVGTAARRQHCCRAASAPPLGPGPASLYWQQSLDHEEDGGLPGIVGGGDVEAANSASSSLPFAATATFEVRLRRIVCAAVREELLATLPEYFSANRFSAPILERLDRLIARKEEGVGLPASYCDRATTLHGNLEQACCAGNTFEDVVVEGLTIRKCAPTVETTSTSSTSKFALAQHEASVMEPCGRRQKARVSSAHPGGRCLSVGFDLGHTKAVAKLAQSAAHGASRGSGDADESDKAGGGGARAGGAIGAALTRQSRHRRPTLSASAQGLEGVHAGILESTPVSPANEQPELPATDGGGAGCGDHSNDVALPRLLPVDGRAHQQLGVKVGQTRSSLPTPSRYSRMSSLQVPGRSSAAAVGAVGCPEGTGSVDDSEVVPHYGWEYGAPRHDSMFSVRSSILAVLANSAAYFHSAAVGRTSVVRASSVRESHIDFIQDEDGTPRRTRRLGSSVAQVQSSHTSTRPPVPGIRHSAFPYRSSSLLGSSSRHWDFLGLCLLFLELIYMPFHYAFLTESDLKNSSTLSAMGQLLVVIDIFWAADMLLNFNTGFFDAKQVLQMTRRASIKRYFKTWFFADLAATSPALIAWTLRWLSSETHEDTSWAKLDMLCLVRVVRFAKFSAYVRRLEIQLKCREITFAIALAKLLALPVIVSHCTACILWRVGRDNLEVDPSVHSWIKNGLSDVGKTMTVAEVPLSSRYICAMYFSVTVMSTVGLGDIAAELPNERSVLMLVMISTSIVVGVAVNGVSQVVSKLGERSVETNEQLTQASNFMKWYSVPSDLQVRVHAYLKQFFDNKEREDTRRGLMLYLRKSDVLCGEMNFALTGQHLAEHRLMSKIPRDLLIEICDICETVFHPPGEVLETPGLDVLRCLYIRMGTVVLFGKAPNAVDDNGNQLPMIGSNSISRSKTFDRAGTVNSMVSNSASREEALSDMKTGAWSTGVPSIQMRQGTAQFDALCERDTLASGEFLSDMRLFLGVARTSRTARCSSFCELISLDIASFRSVLMLRNARLLHKLSIYAAIEIDGVEFLTEETLGQVDEKLLDSDTMLHLCARCNAPESAQLLLANGATVDPLDAEDRTPAQISAAARHGKVFEVLVLGGALVRIEDVLPIPDFVSAAEEGLASVNSDALGACVGGPVGGDGGQGADHRRWRRPSMNNNLFFGGIRSHSGGGIGSDTGHRDAHSTSMDSLYRAEANSSMRAQESPWSFGQFLMSHGLCLQRDPDAFDDSEEEDRSPGCHRQRMCKKGSLEELLREVRNGECVVEKCRGGRLRRRVALVRLRLVCVVDNQCRVLLETQSEDWLASASSSSVARFPAGKVIGGCIEDGLQALYQRIGITSEFRERYLSTVCSVPRFEHKPSETYNGLETDYFYTDITVRVRRLGLAEGRCIGLPHCASFRREEQRTDTEVRNRVYFWAIMLVAPGAEEVVGASRSSVSDTSRSSAWSPPSTVIPRPHTSTVNSAIAKPRGSWGFARFSNFVRASRSTTSSSDMRVPVHSRPSVLPSVREAGSPLS